MTGQPIGLRAAALAAVALVAAAVVLAVGHRGGASSPERLPPRGADWQGVIASPYPSVSSSRGACGVAIGADTRGVGSPTLPCGVKLYLVYRGKEVLTQVVDRGTELPGRFFDVTPALARELGLVGAKRVQYSLAG